MCRHFALIKRIHRIGRSEGSIEHGHGRWIPWVASGCSWKITIWYRIVWMWFDCAGVVGSVWYYLGAGEICISPHRMVQVGRAGVYKSGSQDPPWWMAFMSILAASMMNETTQCDWQSDFDHHVQYEHLPLIGNIAGRGFGITVLRMPLENFIVRGYFVALQMQTCMCPGPWAGTGWLVWFHGSCHWR